MDKNHAIKLNAIDNKSKKYKIAIICNNAVFARKSVDYLLGLYYLVSWKSYLEKKNI